MVRTDRSGFEEFKARIAALELADEYSREQLLAPSFHLASEGRLDVYYAPFDFVHAEARVALVGVTPGWTQVHQSFVVARRGIADGATDEAILREVKRVAAFSGTLRRNLVYMLDGVGVGSALEMESTSNLFEPEGEALLHSTSAIRYPVFNDGENYSGNNPEILKSPVLSGYVEVIGSELECVGSALVVPLGKAVKSVVAELVRLGRLDGRRVLDGMPHPSGANPHRVRQYEANRNMMVEAVSKWAGAG